MADSYVQVAPDDSGKKIQTYENTVGGETVEAQAVVLVDSTGAPITLPTVASTTNLLAGDGSGNAVASLIADFGDGSGYKASTTVSGEFGLEVANYDTGVGSYSAFHLTADTAAATNHLVFSQNSDAGGGKAVIWQSDGTGLRIVTSTNAGITFESNDGSAVGLGVISAQTITSGASVVLDDIYIPAGTATITGSTQITTAKGFNKFSIYKPTYTDASAVTIDRGATLYIEDAPAAAGSVTLTAPYALWVDAGTVRIDGGVSVGVTTTTAAGSINITGNYMVNGTPLSATPGSAAQTTVAGPKTTTSVTAVMAGLAGAITPAAGGSILVAVSGQAAGSSSTALVTAQIRYGTGTAPTLGAATTGTALGIACQLNTGTALQNWFLTGAATGLSAGTAYWVDVQFLTAARTGSISNVCVAVVEG